MYQNSQKIRENTSIMSSENTSIEQEPSTGSSLSINTPKESSHNSSVISRTIRSPSNDQVFLKTAPHMVTDNNPFGNSVNEGLDNPGNVPPVQNGEASALPMSSDIATSSAAVSEITLPDQTKCPEPFSPNPILMGSQALKNAAFMLPATFADASAAYTPACKPPSGNYALKPHLGLPGIHHARNQGKGLDGVMQRHIQSINHGMNQSKAHVKATGDLSKSQMNANAQRIITTLSNTKPGSSAERIKKIIPEQASVFNEKVKPELNRILSQRTARLPVNV